MQEIIDNDYNLNIPRYVNTYEEELPIDMEVVKNRLKEKTKESQKLDKEIENLFEQLGL